jgi:hypothetical protein
MMPRWLRPTTAPWPCSSLKLVSHVNNTICRPHGASPRVVMFESAHCVWLLCPAGLLCGVVAATPLAGSAAVPAVLVAPQLHRPVWFVDMIWLPPCPLLQGLGTRS